MFIVQVPNQFPVFPVYSYVVQYYQWLKWGGQGAQPPASIWAPAIVWAPPHPDWIYKVLFYDQITPNYRHSGHRQCSNQTPPTSDKQIVCNPVFIIIIYSHSTSSTSLRCRPQAVPRASGWPYLVSGRFRSRPNVT